MCDITNRNFEKKYSDIIKDISHSDFIAIDCEFSGLTKDEKNNMSLFDTASERYNKMRRGLDDFIILQIGISLFAHDKNRDYEVSTYVFYLFPRSYSYSSEIFSCNSRSIQFLCQQKFDFNKVFHEGITFIKLSEEKALQKVVEDGSLLARMKSELSNEERQAIQTLCTQVAEWKTGAEEGSSIVLDLSPFDPFTRYLIRDHIENQFSVVTVFQKNFEVKVETGSRDEQARKDELFFLFIGFTALIKEIISMKKPVVGHNMFADLLMFYKTFISPLPLEYNTFKKEISRIFPVIYDTKFLSLELKKMVGKKYLDTPSVLIYLYKYLSQHESFFLDTPIIKYKSSSDTPQSNDHDSGYDSYCTGYVFLKMAHMFCLWDEEDKAFRGSCIGNSPTLYFNAVKSMKNCINVMRGNIAHISLDGPDPKSSRPNFLLVEPKNGAEIDIFKLSDAIARYDAADIRALNNRQALIASSNETTLKLIHKYFVRNKNYRLRMYNPKPAKPSFNMLITTSVLGLAGLLTFIYYNRLSKQQT